MQSPENNKTPGRDYNNALTKREDWTHYYSGLQLEQIEKTAYRTSCIDDYLKNKTGKIFELGCGGSHLLARCALLGWEVGGIDFNADGLELIRSYLSKRNYKNTNLVCGDIFTYDTSQFENEYNIMISFGFLEHFKDPQSILLKWKKILHRDGIVISCIPNLFSINVPLMKKYDPEFWEQHIRYSPRDMDQFHVHAGLVPLMKARYLGKYDVNMLIPWGNIMQTINNRFLFKTTRYIAYYGVGKLLGLLPKSNKRLFNSFILGVYACQPAEGSSNA